jgi:hypothetical protein
MPEGVNQSKRGRALFVEWLVRQLASLYLSISVTARMAAGHVSRPATGPRRPAAIRFAPAASRRPGMIANGTGIWMAGWSSWSARRALWIDDGTANSTHRAGTQGIALFF